MGRIFIVLLPQFCTFELKDIAFLRKGWVLRKESFCLCSWPAPCSGPKAPSLTVCSRVSIPKGCLPRRDGHLGTTFLMFLWLHILLISLSMFSYEVSVSFLAWFVTLLHFCLFLIIWPNTLVFIWFFSLLDSWPTWPVLIYRMMCHSICVCCLKSLEVKS